MLIFFGEAFYKKLPIMTHQLDKFNVRDEFSINDSDDSHRYIFASSNIVADRTLTLPLLTSSDEFTFIDHAATLTNKTITSATNVLTIDGGDVSTGTIPDAQISSSSVSQHQGAVTGTGILNSGSITSGFGSIDNGASGITSGSIQTTGGNLSLSTSALTFGGSTGLNKIIIPDNLADAFNISEGSNIYMSIVTTDSGEKITVDAPSSLTNLVRDVFTVSHTTSGTPANNIGVGIAFDQETSVSNIETVARIEAVATDTTATSEDADLVFYTMSSGNVADEKMRLASNGALTALGARFGTGVADATLTVRQAGSNTRIKIDSTNVSQDSIIEFYTNGTNKYNLQLNGTANEFALYNANSEFIWIANQLGQSAFTSHTALTNTVSPSLTIAHQTSGIPAENIGVGIDFKQETDSENFVVAQIQSVITDATFGTIDADIVFNTMANNTIASERFRVSSTGISVNGDAGIIWVTDLGNGDNYVASTSSYVFTTAIENIIIGTGAGNSITDSSNNILIGQSTGQSLTTGSSDNISIGISSLTGSAMVSANSNIALGSSILSSLTTGDDNISIGRLSGSNVTTGIRNIFLGPESDTSNGTFDYSIAIGTQATITASQQFKIGSTSGSSTILDILPGITNTTNLGSDSLEFKDVHAAGVIDGGSYEVGSVSGLIFRTGLGGTNNYFATDGTFPSITTSSDNVYIGDLAGDASTNANCNVVIGTDSGINITTAGSNTIVGCNTGTALISGVANVIIGRLAGEQLDTNCDANVIIGNSALPNTTSGITCNNNIAIGSQSMFNSIGSIQNTAIGNESLFDLTTGFGNIGIGSNACASVTTGNYNLGLGHGSGASAGSHSYSISLGKDATTLASNQMMIGSVVGASSITSIVPGITSNTDLGSSLLAFQNAFLDGYVELDEMSAPGIPGADKGRLYAKTGSTGLFWHHGDGGGEINISDGEINTASNIGASGVGVFDGKVGVDLQFRNIHAGSTKISVTDDSGNNEIDIDLVQANITGTGILNSGSITSGFGSIDNGVSSITCGALDADSYSVIGTAGIIWRTGLGGADCFIASKNNDVIYSTLTGDSNIFIGNVGISLTSGAYNTLIGDGVGNTMTTGDCNTIMGDSTSINTNGSFNTYFGANINGSPSDGSLNSGSQNSGFGEGSLANLGIGNKNTAIGQSSGGVISSGISNTMLGYRADVSIGTGNYRISLGHEAKCDIDNHMVIGSSTGGESIVAIKPGITNTTDLGTASKKFKDAYFAGIVDADSYSVVGTTGIIWRTGLGGVGCMIASEDVDGSYALNLGENNIFIGNSAGVAIFNGVKNVLIGNNSGETLIAGLSNTMVGHDAGSRSTGNFNSYFGERCGFGDLATNSGSNNCGFGVNSLDSVTTGNNNVAVGYASGNSTTSGSQNTMIGALSSVSGIGNFRIALGYQASSDINNHMVIGSQTGANTIIVVKPGITNTTDLGTTSKKFKDAYFGGTVETSGINDINGNEAIIVSATASAVNHISVTNAAAGTTPFILATGTDTNISLGLVAKGTGSVVISSSSGSDSGILRVEDATGGQYFGITAAATTTTYTLTMPATQGGVGESLSNNGSGVMSWVSLTPPLIKNYSASDFQNPNTSDWSINALAPAVADPNNSALVVRAFDDTVEEGIGWSVFIPTGYSSMTITSVTRSAATPAGNVFAANTLHYRKIPNNDVIPVWTQYELFNSSFSVAQAQRYQYNTQTITFSTFSPVIVANTMYQFELTRNATIGGDTLIGDIYLSALTITFT